MHFYDYAAERETWGRRSEHPPLMLAVYDRDAGGYRLTEEMLCAARHPFDGEGYSKGELCGQSRWKWAGDLPLCRNHYTRLVDWVIDEEILATEMRRKERLYEMETAHRLERFSAMAQYSVVYYLRRVSDGMIKVGFTASLRKRLVEHRRAHGPLEILLVHGGDRDEEGESHDRFSEYRIGRSEWFMPAHPVLDWIRRARNRYGVPDIEPDKFVTLKYLAELCRNAPRREDLDSDDEGYPIWPPRVPAEAAG